MRSTKLRGSLFVFLALFSFAGACRAPDTVRSEQRADVTAPAAIVAVRIASAGAVHHFNVEIARTAAEQERGLMYRSSLPADGGMLFPFDPPQRAMFWMKDTLIPLDMIFIRADGTIARIASKTTPLSLAPVDAGENVAAVLEIGGGVAAAKGIKPGDQVTWPKE